MRRRPIRTLADRIGRRGDWKAEDRKKSDQGIVLGFQFTLSLWSTQASAQFPQMTVRDSAAAIPQLARRPEGARGRLRGIGQADYGRSHISRGLADIGVRCPRQPNRCQSNKNSKTLSE